jgi:hypothetical protein
MTQKKNKVKSDVSETKIVITKHKIGNDTNYMIRLKSARISIWCGSYEIDNGAIWLYNKPELQGYIGNVFINKDCIKEDIKKFC